MFSESFEEITKHSMIRCLLPTQCVNYQLNNSFQLCSRTLSKCILFPLLTCIFQKIYIWQNVKWNSGGFGSPGLRLISLNLGLSVYFIFTTEVDYYVAKELK